MNLSQVKKYTTEVLKQWFKNKSVLDKLNETEAGELLYGEKAISSNPVLKYQKYLNTELDSCFCMLAEDYTPVVGEYVPFAKKSGSFEVNEGKITVKPGQRVQINISMAYGSSTSNKYGNIKYAIKDCTNNVLITELRPINNDGYNEYPEAVCCQYTNETNANCEIGLYVSQIQVSDTIRCYYTSLTVQEIGRQTIIDPIEHVNTTRGLEDTPIGHIMPHMGTAAPRHYLVCDGSEYDIVLYPQLADYILKTFGSCNYFGGNGTTTFCVPDLRDKFLKGSESAGISEEAGLPNITANWKSEPSTDSHGAVTVTSEKGTLQGVTSGGSSDNRLYFDASRSSSVYGNSDTVTPANMSVLFCIKYEHTYYTNVDNTNYLSASLYSEDERIIGSWINGKPIYQKTICTAITEKEMYCACSLVNFNIEHLTDLRAIIQSASWSSKSKYISGFHSKSSESHDAIFTTWISGGGDLYFYSNEDALLNQPIHVIIEYTKTTDAENSFTNDMIKDYISSSNSEDISYTDEEIQAIINVGVAELNEEA